MIAVLRPTCLQRSILSLSTRATHKPAFTNARLAMSMHYDAVIIGSGQGGTPLSMAFAKAQKKTALIESTHVGGCCVNEGCTPTKTMIASGRVAYLTRRGPEYGVISSKPEEVRINMEKVRQRKRDIVDSFRSGSESRLRDAGINVISGSASFENERTIKVAGNNGDDKTITADKIFICTGERPAPPILRVSTRKGFQLALSLILPFRSLGLFPRILLWLEEATLVSNSASSSGA
uniref:FAD/NAD(P)-binding domain-containing protein n=1 Tax=Bionectria ochroleuca TaxID=29856 RepID=A0A8H7TQG8_BIOOC